MNKTSQSYLDDMTLLRKRMDKNEFLRRSESQMRNAAWDASHKCRINGVTYNSHKAAAEKYGVSSKLIQRHSEAVHRSGFSKREYEVKIPTVLTFEKVDQNTM